MISEGFLTNDPDRQTRIEKAVEEETRRRKRLLIIYGLFLVIPFGVGAGFLIFGQSDREALTIEREVLKSEVNRRLAPVEATIKQTEPALKQVRDMAARVSAQEKRLDRLSQVQDSLLQLNASIEEGRQVPVRGLEKELADMHNRLARQDELLAALADDQKIIKNEQARISSEVKKLAERDSAVRPTSYDKVLREHTELLKRLQNEVELLTKRKIGRQSNPQISSK